MKCKYCGNDLHPSADRCWRCGRALSAQVEARDRAYLEENLLPDAERFDPILKRELDELDVLSRDYPLSYTEEQKARMVLAASQARKAEAAGSAAKPSSLKEAVNKHFSTIAFVVVGVLIYLSLASDVSSRESWAEIDGKAWLVLVGAPCLVLIFLVAAIVEFITTRILKRNPGPVDDEHIQSLRDRHLDDAIRRRNNM